MGESAVTAAPPTIRVPTSKPLERVTTASAVTHAKTKPSLHMAPPANPCVRELRPPRKKTSRVQTNPAPRSRPSHAAGGVQIQKSDAPNGARKNIYSYAARPSHALHTASRPENPITLYACNHAVSPSKQHRHSVSRLNPVEKKMGQNDKTRKKCERFRCRLVFGFVPCLINIDTTKYTTRLFSY